MNQVMGIIISVILFAVLVCFFWQMWRAERIKKLKEQLSDVKHDAAEWKLRHRAVEEMYNDVQTKYETLQKKLAEKTREKFFNLDRKPMKIFEAEEIGN